MYRKDTACVEQRMSSKTEDKDEDFEIWPELLGDKHFVLSLPLCDAYLNLSLIHI